MANCPICGSDIKTVPAGISKNTGKEYPSFEVCSNRECGWKPPKVLNVPKPLPKPVERQVEKPCDDGGRKAMIMSYAKDLVIAHANAGVQVDNFTKETIACFLELWIAYKNA